MKLLVSENIKIAVESIKSHKLRSWLTIGIIAFGIMALVGILTSIDAVKYFLKDNFSMMGSNTFTLRNRSLRVHVGGRSPKSEYFRTISYDEAVEFTNRFDYPANASISHWGTGIATIKYKSEKTNPNVGVIGGDINYIDNAGYTLAKGRNFSDAEIKE